MVKRLGRFESRWVRFWLRFGGFTPLGRLSTRIATVTLPPYKFRLNLANLVKQGYISPSVEKCHHQVVLGNNIFIGDRVAFYQADGGGEIKLMDKVRIHRETIFETGAGGSIVIGKNSSIQGRCLLSAYVGSIRVGARVQIAPACAIYPYDHGYAKDRPILQQGLTSKGGIRIGDDAWLGVGVVVLDGVTIGKGAVVGAGAVVSSSIPDYSIAAGVPAKVIRYR